MSTSPQKKTDLPTAAEVDELGQLQAWLAQNKPKIDREDELRKKFNEAFEEHDAAASFEIAGTPAKERPFVALIGPKGNRREVVDKPGVLKRLGKAMFLAICTVPLGKLDAMIEPSEQKGLVVSDKTGSRTVKVVVKPEAA